jgi:hypothetical protein
MRRRLKKNNNKYNTYKERRWGFLDVQRCRLSYYTPTITM